MTPMTKEALAQLRLKAEKATKGEWWSDSIGNEGTYGAGDDCVEGFTSYAVYDENDRVLLDTLNSSAACIQEEYDGEGHVAWDEVGLRNAEFIAAANPATVLALLDELEAKDKHIAEQAREIDSLATVAGSNAAQVKELQSRAESAEQALLLERQKDNNQKVSFPDEINVLLNHLEDVIPWETFQLIDVKKWNAVTSLSAAGIPLQKGGE